MHSSRFSFPIRETGLPWKRASKPNSFQKRRKACFFKLLSAARSRDERLLASVIRSLGEDPRLQEDRDYTDSLRVQDVLLKALSRCGHVDLADSLLKVRVGL